MRQAKVEIKVNVKHYLKWRGIWIETNWLKLSGGD